jgi:hypothetical protein
MKSKVRILVVLKKSSEYTVERALKVLRMFQLNIEEYDVELACLTDAKTEEFPSDITVIPMRYGWDGWYSKMEMFRSDVSNARPTLYADIDTSVVGNIDSLLKAVEHIPFVILRDVYRGVKNPMAMQSSLMWINHDMSMLYREYCRNPIVIAGGDQIVLEHYFASTGQIPIFWQDITNCVVSYKVHIVPNQKLEEHQKVIIFHGKPRPWNQNRVPYK